MTKIISISNHKGGVGKTTSVLNIGHGLARKGKDVLLIDLDPQGNLSQSLLVNYGADWIKQKDVYLSLIGKNKELEPLELIWNHDEHIHMHSDPEYGGPINPRTYKHSHNQGRLHLVCSTINLSGAELELSGEAGREYILSELLQQLFKRTKKEGLQYGYRFTYDYVLIDTPPSIGLLTINSLTASDYVVVPVQAQFLAVMGLQKLLEAIAKIKSRLNKRLKVGGVFLTQYTDRHKLDNFVKLHLKSDKSYKVFKTAIRNSKALATAPIYNKSIFDYDITSLGAQDYSNLVDEILKLK